MSRSLRVLGAAQHAAQHSDRAHAPHLLANLHFRSLAWQLHPVNFSATRLLTTFNFNSNLPDIWTVSSRKVFSITDIGFGGDPHKKPDERTLKLGKTLRILQSRLPTLLQSPLPSDILSPHISLVLFPTTHPHLPTVSGRVAYIAALWSSPLAWGRIPIIGNVKLEILSERMVKKGSSSTPYHYFSNVSAASQQGNEQLVVRWRTTGKTRTTKGDSETVEKITEYLGGKGEDEFTGLFIFEFDAEGRIAKHTIEHVQEGGNWERGVGARVVGLTDWLLAGIKGRNEPEPSPACFSNTSSKGI